MRLNGASFNARPLNSSYRSMVLAAAQAVLENSVTMVGVKHSNGSGQSAILVKGEFRGSTNRFARGSLDLILEGELDQTVSRSGAGSARLEVDADLFYTRVLYGFGSQAISLEMRGDVGIVFIESRAVLELPDTELDGAKLRRVSGTGGVTLSGDLEASVSRRSEGSCSLSTLSGVLEASHVDATGHRYIGGFSEALCQFSVEDGGMLRQAFIGSSDITLAAEGAGRIERTTLAGEVITNIKAEFDFKVQRRAEGVALIALSGTGTGEVFVRGEARAVLSLTGRGTGYKITHVCMDGQPVVLETEMNGVKARVSPGEAVMTLGGQLNGTRARSIDGDAVMALLAPSTAYVNLAAEDDGEQNFIRPGTPREFLRQTQVREWNRV